MRLVLASLATCLASALWIGCTTDVTVRVEPASTGRLDAADAADDGAAPGSSDDAGRGDADSRFERDAGSDTDASEADADAGTWTGVGDACTDDTTCPDVAGFPGWCLNGHCAPFCSSADACIAQQGSCRRADAAHDMGVAATMCEILR